LLDQRLVVLEAEQRSFAVVVDAVVGHHQVTVAKVQEASADKIGLFQAHQMIEGQFDQPGEGVVVTLAVPPLLQYLVDEER
jgi:chemotaxis signal transduction protein